MADRTEPDLLEVGTDAPDFTLISSYGEPFTLSELRGQMHACLIFYPEREMPESDGQLAAARDDRERFIGAGVERIGINPGALEEKQRFAQLHELDFPLLVDADLQVARRFGAAPADEARVLPTVYLIDKEGKIAFARRGMPTTDEILRTLEQ